MSEPAEKGRGGQLGKTDFILIFFAVAVEEKGFWQFGRGKLHQVLGVLRREVFFGHGGNGRTVGVKNADDVRNPDIQFVPDVKIHTLLLKIVSVFDPEAFAHNLVDRLAGGDDDLFAGKF